MGAATTTINTLNQSAVGGSSDATIDPAGQALLTDAILVGTGAGGLTIGTGTNNGTLSAATPGGELAILNNTANAITINSDIVDNSTSALIKTGSGPLTLTGANTYAGPTTVAAGTLNVDASLASQSVNVSGGTANINASITSQTMNVSGGTLNLNTAWVGTTLTVSGGQTNLNAAWTGTGSTLTVSGGVTTLGTAGTTVDTADFSAQAGTVDATNALSVTDTLKFSDTVTATYASGGSATSFAVSNPSGGDIVADTDRTVSPVAEDPAAPATVGSHGDSAGIGKVSGNSTTWKASGGIGSDPAGFIGLIDEVGVWQRALTLNEIQDIYGATSGGTLPGTALHVTGASELSISGPTVLGALTLDADLTISGAGTSASFAGIDGAAALNLGSVETLTTDVATGQSASYSGVIADGTGAVSLIKTGDGTQVLGGDNTYTGETVIKAGTLRIASATALGDTTGTTTLDNGATLDLNGQTIAEQFGSGYNALDGTLINSSSTPAAITGDIKTGSTFDVDGSGDIALDRVLAHGYYPILVKKGSGTLTLSGTEFNAVGIRVQGGTVILAKTGASGRAIGYHSYVDDGATIQLGGTSSYQILGNMNLTVRSGGVFDLNGKDQDFNGGGGKLNLNGTGISDGGALINSQAATTSTLTFGTGGIVLQSDSSIGGAGDISTNGPVSGDFALRKVGAGTVTLTGDNTYTGDTIVDEGTLVLADGGSLNFLIGAAGVNNLISGAGSVDLAGDFNFDLTGANTTLGNEWLLVDAIGATYQSTFSVVGFTDAGNDRWTLDIDVDTLYQFDEATGLLSVAATRLAGDANGDGVVDAADYILVKQNFGNAGGSAFENGDVTGDGAVDWNDLVEVGDSLNNPAGGTTTPEPGSVFLLLAGAGWLLKRRKAKA